MKVRIARIAKRMHNKFRGLYWRQMFVTVGMVLLTLFLLGVSFFSLSYNYARGQENGELAAQAQVVGQLSASYLENGRYLDMEELQHEEDFQRLASFAATVSEVDFLICDVEGHVLLSTDASLSGLVVTMPEEMTAEVLEEGISSRRTDVDGLYSNKRFVVGVPAISEDTPDPVGMVYAVSSTTSLDTMWSGFIGLFFMTAFVVLMISFMASSITTMRQIQPIREMAKATRRYAEGDFDIRMNDYGRDDELGELAASFNNMAENLQQTERQRREFITNISHELKTPMTTIAGYTDGILDGTIPPERQSHYLHIVSDEVKRLSRLVRTMLNLSRIDNGELKLRPNDFDISETVLSTVLTFEKSIDEKKIDIRGLDTLQPMQVHGDEDLLHQVVYNLIENAVKFTNTEGYISFNVSDSIDRIVVTIENSGSGIQSDELPLVFEKFYKTDKSRSQDKNGMGLGLYLVRTIIKLHGGDISVSSVVNEYTRFSFYIPKPQEPPKLKYNTGSIPVTVPVEDAVISERPKKEHHGHKDNKEPDQK